MNKKIIVIVLLILVAGLGAWFYWQNHQYKNYSNIQSKVTNTFKDSAYSLTYSTGGDLSIKGNLDKSHNFQGDLLMQDTVVRNVLVVGDKSYTKTIADKNWQIQEDQTILSPLDIIKHPEYIQIQKLLSTSGGNLEYSIIYEKPDQNVKDQIPAETLAKLQLSGTIVVNASNFQLKQMKLHQGTNSKSESVIDYTQNTNPPIIKAP